MKKGRTHARPTEGQILPFHSQLSNIGNHYNTTTCKFTCPVKGVYLFIYFLDTGWPQKLYDKGNGSNIQAHLTIDSNPRPELVICHSNVDVRLRCGNSAVVECEKGQKVWMEALADGSRIQTYSTFSGFLIKRLEEESLNS